MQHQSESNGGKQVSASAASAAAPLPALAACVKIEKNGKRNEKSVCEMNIKAQ
jgi:hypothetical protein